MENPYTSSSLFNLGNFIDFWSCGAGIIIFLLIRGVVVKGVF